MRIERLDITNFRNLKDIKIDDFQAVNVIYGANAQGKTSLIEAIGFLSTLKSFRGDENANLINWDEDYSKIEARAVSSNNHTNLKVVISKGTTKMFINNKELKKASDFIGVVNVVTFDPSDVFLFKESPKKRREFLDDELSKLSPAYYQAKGSYAKLLRERNELLKSPSPDESLLDVITKQMAKINSEIAIKRSEIIKNLSDESENSLRKLLNQNVRVRIEYQNQFDNDYTPQNIEKKIKESYQDDLLKKATQIGIHRDDFIFYLNDKPIAHYGSQGQNRLSAIALKLAAITIAKNKTGEEAIVVLDDVLSELDENKKEKLIDLLKKENQVFITTAQELNSIQEFKNLLNIRIKDGKVEGAE